jgi:hypothetical protein
LAVGYRLDNNGFDVFQLPQTTHFTRRNVGMGEIASLFQVALKVEQ